MRDMSTGGDGRGGEGFEALGTELPATGAEGARLRENLAGGGTWGRGTHAGTSGPGTCVASSPR